MCSFWIDKWNPFQKFPGDLHVQQIDQDCTVWLPLVQGNLESEPLSGHITTHLSGGFVSKNGEMDIK